MTLCSSSSYNIWNLDFIGVLQLDTLISYAHLYCDVVIQYKTNIAITSFRVSEYALLQANFKFHLLACQPLN